MKINHEQHDAIMKRVREEAMSTRSYLEALIDARFAQLREEMRRELEKSRKEGASACPPYVPAVPYVWPDGVPIAPTAPYAPWWMPPYVVTCQASGGCAQ